VGQAPLGSVLLLHNLVGQVAFRPHDIFILLTDQSGIRAKGWYTITKKHGNEAHIISEFISPPAFAILASIIFSFYSPLGLGVLLPLSSVLLGTVFFSFFPFLPVILLSLRKNVRPPYSGKKARTSFFLMALASYSIATVIFYATGTKIMFLPAFGYVCVTLVLMIIDVFWRISAHCAGVAGPITALFYVYGMVAVPLFLFLVPLSWARVALREHTVSQTIGGALIAATIALAEYALLYP
jgi:hypothetical protein